MAKKMLGLVMMGVLGMAVAAQATVWVDTGLVKDGDFASLTVQNGWVLEQGQVSNNLSCWNEGLGNPAPCAVLRGSNPSGIVPVLMQEITGLQPYTDYRVTVDTNYYGGGSAQPWVSATLAVSDLSDQSLGSITRNGTLDYSGWSTEEVDFNTQANTGIRIRLEGCEFGGEPEIYFDNVVLFVPEPITLGIMLLGGLLGLRRRG